MPVAGEIVVRLIAKTNKFEAKMRRSSKAVGGMQKTAMGARTSLLKMVGPLAAVGAASAAASAAAAFAFVGLKKAFTEIEAISLTSEKLGIATEALVGLQFAAERTGVGTKTLDMALQRMVRRIAEAAMGTGEARDAIKELGLSAEALAQLAPDQQFHRLADAMQGVAMQGDRVRLAMKLFDSEGVALVNTLALGSDGLARMQSRAEELGKTFSDIDGRKIREAADAIADLKALFSGGFRGGAIGLAPVVKEVAGLAEVMQHVTEQLTGGQGFWFRLFNIPNVPATLGNIAKLTSGGAQVTADNAAKQAQAFRDRLRSRTAPRAPSPFLRSTDIFDPQDRIARSTEIATVASDQLTESMRRQIAIMGGASRRSLEISKAVDAMGNSWEAFNASLNLQKLDDALAKLENANIAKTLFNQVSTPLERFTAQISKLQKQLGKGIIDEGLFKRAVIQAEELLTRLETHSLFAATRTPFERFQAQILNIQKLLARGKIDPDVFNRATAQAEAALAAAERTTVAPSPQALERGSAAAFSAMNQARRSGGVEGLLQQQLGQMQQDAHTQDEGNRLLKNMNENLKPVGVAAK